MRTLISLILVVLFSLLLAPHLTSCGPMSQERIEADFRRDKEDILIVKEFLIALEYPNIHISGSPDYEMWIAGVGVVTIEDDEVVAAIGRLRRSDRSSIRILLDMRYNVIIKNNNLVRFQRWATLDIGRGVFYSIDGSDPNDWNRLPSSISIAVPLPEPGWFFYESG